MDRKAFLVKSAGAVVALSVGGLGCQPLPTLPIPNDRPILPRTERRFARGNLVAGTEARFDLGDGRAVPGWGYEGVARDPCLPCAAVTSSTSI